MDAPHHHLNPMRCTALLVLSGLLAACGTSPRNSADALSDASEAADAPDASESDVESDVVSDAEAETSADAMVDVVPEDTSPADSGPQDTSPADSGNDLGAPPDAMTDIGPIDAGSATIEALCNDACTTRETVNAGLCEVSEAPCTESCGERAPEDDALLDAYLGCIESDPLCFQTMLQCVVSRVLPEPFEHVVTLEASGFEDYVGARFYAGIDEAAGRLVRIERAIDAPTFTEQLDVFMSASQSHLVLWFVDVDGDGECTPETDLTGSSSYDLWAIDEGRIALPDWRIQVAPNPEQNAGFVCDFL